VLHLDGEGPKGSLMHVKLGRLIALFESEPKTLSQQALQVHNRYMALYEERVGAYHEQRS
jgi:hypothetical protein